MAHYADDHEGIEVAQSSHGIAITQRKFLTHLGRRWYVGLQACGLSNGSNTKLIQDSSPGQGLLYEDKGHTNIVGYSDDADWAGSPFDRRSTLGYCV
ncbi:hypothetical protein MTR67_038023 [Solanum verrucosum]|uniref:Uncharacterized protein n=1 Tax=Solanum verrucosum TaxID=315347 RepID=A0AAF0UF13_SOLVR|nr:hypothetical protein MTR67_038023 [Solanum verrucosum]